MKAKAKAMIVKVQVPLRTNYEEPLALVYNRDRSYQVFMQITEDLKIAMDGHYKKFFYAHYDKENNHTVLDKAAPWQQW